MGPRAIFQIVMTRGLPGQVKQLLKGIIRCFKIRKLVAEFKVGLDNPADTGFLFALIGGTVSGLFGRFLTENI